MRFQSWMLVAVATLACLFSKDSLAQGALLDEVHTIAAADQAVPVEHTFSIATQGTYTVTLTDLGAGLTPAAPLSSVKLAISSGSSVVGTPLTAAGSGQFTAAPGDYIVHVVGAPGSVPGSGLIGIEIKDSGGSQVATFSDVLAPAPAATPQNRGLINDTVTVDTSGNYVVSLVDLQLPQNLQVLQLIVIAAGSSTPTAILPDPGNGNAMQATVALQSGTTYRIFAVGQADPAVNAGLFTAVVSPAGGGDAVFSRSIPVGTVTAIGSASLTAAGYTLSLTDLLYPAPLLQAGAVLERDGVVASRLSAVGNNPFTAPAAGTYQLFTLATAAAPGAGTTLADSGTGSYAVEVRPASGPAVISAAHAVTAQGSSFSTYTFDAAVTSAGAYQLSLGDFLFPTALQNVGVVAIQGATVLVTPLTAPGSASLNLAQGDLSLLVFARAKGTATLADSGMFGITVTPASGAALVELTQTVGQLFTSRKVSVLTAGRYTISVADLGFPAPFGQLAAIATRGTTAIASIFGAGKFSFDVTDPGNYYVSFLAQPAGADEAGTYALNVAPAPAAPVITLTAEPTQVDLGATARLTWSTQNATACTASGGWTGTRATSGSETTPQLTANTDFTLTCDGPGGSSAPKTITVTVLTPSKTGGGGGAIDGALLLVLGSVLVGGFLVRRRRENGVAWNLLKWTAGGISSGHAAVAIAVTALLILGGCGGAQSRFSSHMDRARENMAAGNYDKAGIEARNALQIMPKNADALYLAGRISEKQGKVREALGAYQAAVDVNQDNVQARAALGRVFLFAGQIDQASETVEPALAKHPDEPELLAVRAAVRIRRGDVDGGTADAERALKLDPKNENALALLASVYSRQDGPQRAIDLLTNGIKRLPDSTDLRVILANLYAQSGQPGRAEEQIRNLIRLKPQALSFRNELAVFYARQKKFDDAQRVLEEATTALPHNDEAKLGLVDFLTNLRSPQEGEKRLRAFIEKNPDDYALRLGLGSMLQRSGNMDGAVKVYQDIAARDPENPNALVARDRIAAIALFQGREVEAKNIVAEVLKKNPRDSEALALRSELELRDNDATAAIADLRAVLREQPSSLALRLSLARAYRAHGEPALAEETLRSAMELSTENFDVRIELADLLAETGRSDQAVSLLEGMVRSAPSDARAREALVRAYLTKRDFKAARTAAEDLQVLAPKSATGFYLAGLAAKGDGRADEAAKQLDQALALNPGSPDILSARAQLDIEKGRLGQAVALISDAAQKSPKSAAILDLLGETYMAAKDYPRAVDTFERTIQLAPKWWIPYRDLAQARKNMKDSQGAIRAYEAGIKAVPTEPELVIAAADLYTAEGRVDDAIARYEALHKLNPHLELISNNLAMLLANRKTDKQSLDRANELIAGFASSERPELLDTSGWVHLKRGEIQEAMQVLERALERAPDSRVIRYHLAMAQMKAGEREKARTNLQTALGNSAVFEGSQEARVALSQLSGNSG